MRYFAILCLFVLLESCCKPYSVLENNIGLYLKIDEKDLSNETILVEGIETNTKILSFVIDTVYGYDYTLNKQDTSYRAMLNLPLRKLANSCQFKIKYKSYTDTVAFSYNTSVQKIPSGCYNHTYDTDFNNIKLTKITLDTTLNENSTSSYYSYFIAAKF
jgi:hypothetical protein